MPVRSLVVAFGKPGGQKRWPRSSPTGRRGHHSPWHVLEAGALPVLKGPKNQLRIKLPLFLVPRKPSVIKSGSGRMPESLCSLCACVVQAWPVTSDGTNPEPHASLWFLFSCRWGGSAGPVGAAPHGCECRGGGRRQGREMSPLAFPGAEVDRGFDLHFLPKCPYILQLRLCD